MIPCRQWLAAMGLFVACAAATRPAAAQSHASMARWEAFDWRRDTVEARDVEALPLEDVQRLRALVFGRHGRVFARDTALAAWLRSRPWYRASDAFHNDSLNATERENLARIRRAEAARHAHIEPGDLQFWQDRAITQAHLRRYTPAEWEVLKLEVEALRGRPVPVFDDEYAEQEDDTSGAWRYFQERYWYRADSAYTLDRLGARERANLDTLRLAEMRQHAWRLEPGVMELLRHTVITDSMVGQNTLYELRILRNEIFARHGRRFRTPWLAHHFAAQSWYAPRADFSDTLLTPVEKANLLTIARVEARRHEELSTTDVGGWELQGLEADDARMLRYEIYARRGIVFSDPRVQAYFASLPWYKPNPAYRDALLTDRERRNVVAILEYEAMAKGGIKFYPPG